MVNQMECYVFLKSPTLLKAVTVMNQTLEGYTSRFWKNIFRPKYIDLAQSVQSYLVYRYPVTSAKHFSFANTAADSVVNATLNLARHSETILSRMTQNYKKKEDEKYEEKDKELKKKLFCVAMVISEPFFAGAYFRPDFATIERKKFASRYF